MLKAVRYYPSKVSACEIIGPSSCSQTSPWRSRHFSTSIHQFLTMMPLLFAYSHLFSSFSTHAQNKVNLASAIREGES
jgi:hypothetical protein